MVILLLAIFAAEPASVATEAPGGAPQPVATASEAESRASELRLVAKGLFTQRRYAEAIAKFRESNEVRPNLANTYNIGKCHERLGEAGPALRHYREYLRLEPTAGQDTGLEADLTNTEALLRKKGLQQLVVYTDPPTAQVTVNGQAVAGSPAYVELPSGEHQLTVAAEGYERSSVRIVLSIDRIAETTVALRRASTPGNFPSLGSAASHSVAGGRAVALRASPELLADAPTPSRRSLALVVGGAGVVSIGLGVLFGVLAQSDYRRTDALQTGPSRAEFDAARAATVREMVLANIGYGVGAIALGVGLYFALTSDLLSPRLSLSPTAGGGTLVLSGRL